MIHGSKTHNQTSAALSVCWTWKQKQTQTWWKQL